MRGRGKQPFDDPNGAKRPPGGSKQPPDDPRRDKGPESWLLPFLEMRASRVLRKGEKVEYHPATANLQLTIQPERKGGEAIAPVAPTFWLDALLQFHQRKAVDRKARAFAGKLGPGGPGMPGIPGQSNWIPIGPSVARKGQAAGNPGVSGRVARIAVAPGGNVVYVATALGGVWRSDDAGATWKTNEDSFDIDPTAFGSTSLACGAIAINPASPMRVYVGTGEGDTNLFFASRFSGFLPAYRGIGPLRSDNGGVSWQLENIASGSGTLAGESFFQLAVDPGNGDRVVGATTIGLYRREPDTANPGQFHWVRKRTGIHSDVVVARTGGVTTFFAAEWGGLVYSSPDGDTWTAVGTSFPTGGGRIALAVRPTDPSVLYALVSDGSSANVLGLVRLNASAGPWRTVTGSLGSVLGGQAWYTCAFTVDPVDANTVYIGSGSTFFSGDYSGTLNRGTISPSGVNYTIALAYIGGTVHGDIHHVVHAPGASNTLWLGCDGGVFVSNNPTAPAGTAAFTARNTGLATLAMNYFSQHPTQAAVIFCGAQDNGTIRYTGEEAWKLVREADGGSCIVNWNDPYQVIIFQNGTLQRTTDGGATFPTFVTPPGYSWFSGMMAPPIAGAPQSGTPADSGVIALGGSSVFLSTDFGTSWGTIPTGTSSDAFTSKISAIAFASPTKLFIGLLDGRVYRMVKTGATWSSTRIDNAAGGALAVANIITHIAVDPADAAGNSIYVSIGGSGDYRHVWRYNGTNWSARSGPSPGAVTSLLDVEHNAIAVDPNNTATVFVGADVGAWRSTDGGANWTVFSDNLPDAAVLDLKVHQAARLLRASTHGRGLWEFKLDPPPPPDVELYVRDTLLDTGRGSTIDYLPDPEQQGQVDVHWNSANIKVDVPTPGGYQTPTNAIDFFQFVDVIQDGSAGVATMDSAAGTVTNRVYVEVHNRGIVAAGTVKVMLLLTDASPGLPNLPAGYTANVVAGTPVGGAFTLVGVTTLTDVRVGVPQVAAFALPSTILPPPASLPGDSHYCLLALLHSSQDPFTATQTQIDNLTVGERKAAQKNLHIVPFVGIPPPPSPATMQWVAFHLHGDAKAARTVDLVFDSRRFAGTVGVALPKVLTQHVDAKKSLQNLQVVKQGDIVHTAFTKLTAAPPAHLATLAAAPAPHRAATKAKAAAQIAGVSVTQSNQTRAKALLAGLAAVQGVQPLLVNAKTVAEVRGVTVPPKTTTVAFVGIQPPAGAKIGDKFDFDIVQRPQEKGVAQGGMTISLRILAPYEPAKKKQPAKKEVVKK